MPVFLILSTLSVAFYVVLLFALYRDNRRRRFVPHAVRKVGFGVVAELGITQSLGDTALVNQRRTPSNIIVQPSFTPSSQKSYLRTGVRTPAKLVSMRLLSDAEGND